MRSRVPVSPTAYGVALVLADGPLHPYAIVDAVADLDAGIDASRATIYRVVERMAADGWVAEVTSDDPPASRRRAFALTERGRRAVRAESRRIGHLWALADARGLA